MGAFLNGLANQAGRNAVLQPLWGSNVAAANVDRRRGEKTADWASIGLGGGTALAAGGALVYLSRARVSGGLLHAGRLTSAASAHGASRWKLAAAAIGVIGLAEAAAGVVNLFAKLSDKPLPLPGPVVPPPVTRPPSDPPTPPTTPPGEPVPPVPGPDPKPKPHPHPHPHPHPKPHPHPGHHHKPVVYTVRAGDYLTHIAACYDVSWRGLYWRNRSTIGPNPDQILAGQRLIVPERGGKVPVFHYVPTYKPGIKGDAPPCPPGSKACPKP